LNRPVRGLWTLALPLIASHVLHTLYIIVDFAFIGRLGAEALAAATYIGALFFAAVAMITGLITGVTANVAQAFGRRDRETAGRIGSGAVGFGMAMGFVLLAGGLTMGRWMISILGARGDTALFALQYFQIISVGMPLAFTSAAIRSVLIGEGNARTPMRVMIMATFINLALDPVLMFGFGLGIRGAAFATLIAQAFSLAVFGYIVFVKKSSYVSFRLSMLVPSFSIMKPVLRVGIPAGFSVFVIAIGRGMYNRLAAEFGQIAVAGYGAGSKVDLVVALPVLGLASSTVSLMGIFAGAKRTDLIRKMALYTYRSVVFLAVVLGVIAFFASDYIIGFFTADPEALEVGRNYLTYMVFAYPLMAVGMTSGRLLQGLGYGIPAMVIAMFRVLILAIPFSYVSVLFLNRSMDYMWIGIILGALTANILAVLWVYRLVWKMDPTVRARIIEIPEEKLVGEPH